MKRKIKLSVLLVMIATLAFSQGKRNVNSYEKLKVKKVALITEHVNLTQEEAEKFWPLYNELQEKKRELRQDRRYGSKRSVEIDYEKVNAERIESELQKALLEKEYYEKMKEILSAEKIYQLHQAERTFKKELLMLIKNNN